MSRRPHRFVLVKWYDWTKWLLDRVDGFPKNQRFIFGQRLADFEKEVVSLHEQLSADSYRHGGDHYFTIHEPKERVWRRLRFAIAWCLTPSCE